MSEEAELTVTLSPAHAAPIREALTRDGVLFRTRTVRAFDGESELMKVIVAAGTRAVTRIVDALGDLIGKRLEREPPERADEPEGATPPAATDDARVDLEMRIGEMTLSVQGATVDEAKRLIAFIEREPGEG